MQVLDRHRIRLEARNHLAYIGEDRVEPFRERVGRLRRDHTALHRLQPAVGLVDNCVAGVNQAGVYSEDSQGMFQSAGVKEARLGDSRLAHRQLQWRASVLATRITRAFRARADGSGHDAAGPRRTEAR
jgi:hypothetical protein